MSDLRHLYQEVILDHSKSPRNQHRLDRANRSAEGYNPLCGDRLTLYLDVENGMVKDVAFEGSGCAISTASASLMTDAVKGLTLQATEELFGKFHDMVTACPMTEADTSGLGKLAVFSGVREFPTRVKCATLAWHTLVSACKDKHAVVTTETEEH